MKYALIFVATAAAHEAYGGYGSHHESSAVVESSFVHPTGYTTVVPGYGKEPVTVTAQNQPYPTCVSPGYGGNTCAKWDEDVYVSTVIKDYDNNYATITKTEQPVTVYHTKKTITHSATATVGYAAPTGLAPKNGTEGCWYELYEKIEEVPYKQLGPHALPGYPGSGLYKEGEKKQPVLVKEYKGGKWSEYSHEYSYGTPEPEVSTFEKPGVYTVPSKDVTVEHPVTYPAEATKTAKAGETCTYGGQYIDAKETGYVTGAYGAYETKVEGGKTVTETVVKHTTIYASTTGKYEVAKPTTTVYDQDTEVAYPTAKHYEAGVYHHEAKTVTVTKGGQAYTCDYEQTKKYEATTTPKGGKEYPAKVTSVPAHGTGYAGKPSGTPEKPTQGEGKHPAYPGKPTGENNHPSYPSKPTGEDDHPAYPGKPTEGENKHPAYPAKPTEGEHEHPAYPAKPTEGEKEYPGKPTGETDHPAYPGKPTEGEKEYPAYPSKPTEGEGKNSSYPVSAMSSSMVHESYSASTPVAVHTPPYNGDNTYPAGASSTPCSSSLVSIATPVVSSAYNTESTGYPASSVPVAISSVYNAYPTSMSSVYVPVGYKPSSVKPEDASSTPCESSAIPTAYEPETYVVPTPTPKVEEPVEYPAATPEVEKPAGGYEAPAGGYEAPAAGQGYGGY